MELNEKVRVKDCHISHPISNISRHFLINVLGKMEYMGRYLTLLILVSEGET